ncbi:DUF6516 family protein [Thermosulfurimonas sp.]|uniref:toxin-antitoxin system TumE family protein n=1 Tax=Thermosulfurimonas sp. TaxID=2080236 RepID=UPI0025E01B6F|nr:DUF6516 family protein [Thermosulfurimonas sp.]
MALSEDEIMEIKIWEVSRSKDYPEGVKYSLVYLRKGKRILGYDNYQGHGHHKHFRGKTAPYEFHSVERLFEDFLKDLEEARNEGQNGEGRDQEP